MPRFILNHYRSALGLLACAFISTASAQEAGVDYQWELKRDKKGIKVFTSPVKGSPYRAVKAEMTIKGKSSSLVALIQDVDNCPAWADLCKKSNMFKHISPQEQYIYTYNDIPFPIKDRDVLAQVQWQQNPASYKVSMTSKATTGLMEKTKAVRIENAISQWHFTPQKNGLVLVENFAHIDPNGPTPASITNLLLIDSPYKTMIKMRKIIESGQYKNAQFDFVKEPN